jgi:hypothetical protein
LLAQAGQTADRDQREQHGTDDPGRGLGRSPDSRQAPTAGGEQEPTFALAELAMRADDAIVYIDYSDGDRHLLTFEYRTS